MTQRARRRMNSSAGRARGGATAGKRAAGLLVLALLLGLAPGHAPGAPPAAPSTLDPRLRAARVSSFAADRLGVRADADAPISCFIEGDVTPEDLRAAGAEPGTLAGGRLTVRVPWSRLTKVAGLPGVRRIRGATRVEPLLSLSVPDTRADLVRNGIPDTATGLAGDNVLVGVVDSGIDWHHADFKKSDGTTRIAALWDQTDMAGPHPAGYSYGTGWTASDIDLGLCREQDSTYYGHGTHVMGIAAGNGRATGGGKSAFTWIGMAPRAKLAVVSTTWNDADIVDGVAWILGRAASLGLPAVINLSLGTAMGPHDGTTDFELALNALSGPGRLVVASAGNGNGAGSHADKTVPVSGEGVISLRILSYTPSSSKSEGLFLDGWYEGGDNLTVSVKTPGGQTVGPVAKGTVLTAATTEGYVSIDQAGVESTNTNGDVEVLIEISDAGGVPAVAGDWEIRMTRVSAPHGGHIDYWLYEHSFPSTPAFVTGRTESGLVLAPATADSVLGVAAHTTRVSWVAQNGSTYNYGQTQGAIATFSAIGPRRDGAQKPDLSAPGTAIGSSHSSTSKPNPAANLLPDGVHKILQGTSMSCPHVAGALALLLGKWPWLSAAQAKSALNANARSDGVTGTVPNATWGWGRLDVQRVFAARLAFTVAAGPGLVTCPGGRVYLTGLCAQPAAGTWSTRYRLRVSDSKGWLEFEDGGTPAPVTAWSGLTDAARPGDRRCAPVPGELSIHIPSGASSGEVTTVMFSAEPEGLPLMKLTTTTTVTASTIAAEVAGGTRPMPARLGLSVVAAGSAPAMVISGSGPVILELAAPRAGHAEVALYDVAGRRRATLWDGDVEAGFQHLSWTGLDASGLRLAGGIYFARATDGVEAATTRLIVAR